MFSPKVREVAHTPHTFHVVGLLEYDASTDKLYVHEPEDTAHAPNAPDFPIVHGTRIA